MAGYRQHIGFSGLLGLAYGAGATWMFGFTPVEGTLAFMATWFAGMLPDIDSQSGRPVQEIFSVVAVLAPLCMMQHLISWGGDYERVLLLCLAFYILIRKFGASLLGRLSVHRGMFHSIPAMLIASLVTFLYYKSDHVWVRVLMAGGVGLGFLSHLVLDEIYSVQWTGTRIRLAKSSGSALKWFGRSVPANAFCWGAVMFLSYLVLSDLGVLVPTPGEVVAEPPAVHTEEEAGQLEDAPPFDEENAKKTVEAPPDPQVGEKPDRTMFQ